LFHGNDLGSFVLENAKERRNVFVVFPRDVFVRSEGGFGNFFAWRGRRNAAEIDFIEPGTIGGTKKRSNVMERPNIEKEERRAHGECFRYWVMRVPTYLEIGPYF
jgi:hypothetical protein